MLSNVRGEITYSLLSFKSTTVEVWGWIRNFIPYPTIDVITYPCWDFKLNNVYKRGPRRSVDFPSQMDSDAESISISWRHHGFTLCTCMHTVNWNYLKWLCLMSFPVVRQWLTWYGCKLDWWTRTSNRANKSVTANKSISKNAGKSTWIHYELAPLLLIWFNFNPSMVK